MTALSEKLLNKYYVNQNHPYLLFQERIDALLPPGGVLLDAGCGRPVPVLRKYLGRAGRLVGIELVDFTDVPPGIEAYKQQQSCEPAAGRRQRRPHNVAQRFRVSAGPRARLLGVFHGASTRRRGGLLDSQHVGLRGAGWFAWFLTDSMPGLSSRWKSGPRKMRSRPPV